MTFGLLGEEKSQRTKHPRICPNIGRFSEARTTDFGGGGEVSITIVRKSLGVHKFLSAKFGFTPPPPKKRPQIRQTCTNQWKILKI